MSEKAIFTDQELNSNDGMLTSVWGPALWHTLHTISFNYPVNPTKEQRQHYMEFITSLGNVLPCGACRKNLVSNLAKCPLTLFALKNRKNFSRWMYRLHEHVNIMLGKKSKLSYEEVAQRYENFRARCKPRETSSSPQKIESGCVEPVTGVKSRCVISIVPHQINYPTFVMDKNCYQRRDIETLDTTT